MIDTRIYRIGLVLALLFSAAVLVTFPKWSADDAYITYRYAENLARHGQLTYNVGEPPVEGYTGVALPVVLAGAIRLGLDPDLVSKGIGVASYLLGCLILILIARRLRFQRMIELAAVALYLTLPLTFTHVFAGLETMLFSGVLVAVLLFLIRCFDSGPKSVRDETALWFFLLLACLVRPEGMAMAGLSGMALVLHRWFRDRNSVRRLVLRGLLFLAVPLAVYFTWKLSYYGDLLPNSYYAKSSGGTNMLSVGWMKDFWHRYVSFLATAGGLLWLMPLVDLIRKRPALGNLSRGVLNNLWMAVILGLTAACGYEYSQSYLWMNYSLRFFVPFYLPILIIIAHLANLGYNRTFVSGRPWRRIWIPIAAGLLVIIQIYRHVSNLPAEYRATNAYMRLMQEALIPAGTTLHEAIPPDEWLAVHVDAGAMPYFSQLRTVDLGKLNDPVLARQTLSDQELVDYAFAHNPGAWVIMSESRDSLKGRQTTAMIAHDPRLQGYTRTAIFFTTARPVYFETVYIRNDLMPSWNAVYQVPK